MTHMSYILIVFIMRLIFNLNFDLQNLIFILFLIFRSLCAGSTICDEQL